MAWPTVWPKLRMARRPLLALVGNNHLHFDPHRSLDDFSPAFPLGMAAPAWASSVSSRGASAMSPALTTSAIPARSRAQAAIRGTPDLPLRRGADW